MTEKEQLRMLHQAVQNLMLLYRHALAIRRSPDDRSWFGRLMNEPVDESTWTWQVTPENSHVLLQAQDAVAGRPHNCIERGCGSNDSRTKTTLL